MNVLYGYRQSVDMHGVEVLGTESIPYMWTCERGSGCSLTCLT